MTWLDRVRQKNFAPIIRDSDTSAKSQEADYKNFHPYELASAESAKSQQADNSVTFGTPLGVGQEDFAAQTQVMIIAYQRFWLDYDLRDGTYTPAELQQAKLLVKRGPVLRYRLHWPGGTPQPIDGADTQASRLRSQPNAVGAPVVAVQRRTDSGDTDPGIKCL